MGSTACSGNPSAGGIVCNNGNRNRVRLADFDPDTDVVVVDIASLFDATDLTQVTTCHSSGDECAPFFEKVGIDLASGLLAYRDRARERIRDAWASKRLEADVSDNGHRA